MSISDHDVIGRVYRMNNIKFNARTTIRCVEIIDTITQNSYKKIFMSQILAKLKISNQQMMHRYFLNPH